MSKKQTEMQKYEPQALATAEQSIEALTKLYPEGEWNLLVPKMMVSTLPEGTRLVATRIDINANEREGDVYKVPFSKLAIGKAKLNEISKALGADWIVSRRVGDRRNPHYIEWEVVGKFIQPDGSVFTEHGNKTIDLRSDIGDGTPGADAQEMMRNAAKKDPPRDPTDEITKARQNIQMLAETKAKNRAIRAAAAMKTSYTAQELRKPFLAVKLAIDPKSELGSRAVVAQLAGATASMYGPEDSKVVDATFEEPTAGAEPPAEAVDQEGSGDGVQPGPSTSEEPPHDEETGEVVGTKQVIDRVLRLWGKAEAAGMSGESFVALAETQTGKTKKEEMSQSDVESIKQAVDLYVSEKASPV